jgi:hypothetical protein
VIAVLLFQYCYFDYYFIKNNTVEYFLYNFSGISPNVLVATDGLPARIKAYEARPRLANCGGVRRGNEQSDLADRTLAALAAYSYNPVMRSTGVYNYPFIYS